MTNILLVVLDAVRKDHLSPYGYDRPTTPELNSLARTATRYEHAIAAAPWTPPSHASLFTGKYPSHCGVFGRQPKLTGDQPTLAEELSRVGYNTFGFSNSYHTSSHRDFDRGFDFYHDMQALPQILGHRFEPSVAFCKAVAMKLRHGYDDFSYFQLQRLERILAREPEPFFAFINLNSAHSPYDPPPRFKEEFEEYFDGWGTVDESTATAVADWGGYEYMMGEISMTETEWDLIRCWYDGELAYLDSLLGTLFARLRTLDLFDDTAIIVTSDHGEHFGENGLAYHQFSLSETLINVPLLVKWPHQHDGKENTELVSLTDIAPTCLDLVGDTPSQEMDGRSLLSDPEPDAVFAEYGRPYRGLLERLVDAMFSRFDADEDSIGERLAQYRERVERYDRGLQAIRTADHKLVHPTSGGPELYRIDRYEREIDDDELAVRLLDQLDRTLGELPTGSYNEDVPDHVEQHLEKMGYL